MSNAQAADIVHNVSNAQAADIVHNVSNAQAADIVHNVSNAQAAMTERDGHALEVRKVDVLAPGQPSARDAVIACLVQLEREREKERERNTYMDTGDLFI